MLTERQIVQVLRFAELAYEANDKFHTIEHAKESARISLELAKAEGGNEDVCWVSAMLHDISRGLCEKNGCDHGSEGAKYAKEFLVAAGGFDQQLVDGVYDSIYFHNKEFLEGPIERQIVWDADKLQSFTLDGFKSRLCTYWYERLGEKWLAKVKSEYQFYYDRFHTKTAQLIIAKHRPSIEAYINSLEAQ